MCGIAGMVRTDGIPAAKSTLEKMTRALVHRGPDDEGFFFDHKGPTSVGLGFRRLSIIDLAGGHQPMTVGRYTIVFNGEIYNFRQLRGECQARGAEFKTQSDTEVILRLFEQLGEAAFEKLNGMFALAIWDSEARELVLARDRMGIKPLYYVHDQSASAFASEMKSLYLSGLVPLDYDTASLSDYLSYRFVPGPHSILKEVKKVPPGSLLKLKHGRVEIRPYWIWPQPAPDRRPASIIQKDLEKLLEEAVKSQMVSDVPLGAFLSGGVDSSLITAFMAKNSSKRIQTFSIGFDAKSGVDESPFARDAAKKLGTEHHELVLSDKDLFRAEKVFSVMNEPVADPTILPTALLAEFTRKSVKVALTGEGADELFGGYNRYKGVRYPFLNQFKEISPAEWFSRNRDFSPDQIAAILPGWQEKMTHMPVFADGADRLNSILALECRTSLIDRLLMKVDMASMAHSLEARPPYLDPRVVEFSMKIPSPLKIRWFKGKHILRKIAEKHLPPRLCWRRKHGFIVPIWDWIGSKGRDWLVSLFEPSFFAEIPQINKAAVQKHLEKSYNTANRQDIAALWPLAVLALWRKSLKEP